MHDQLVAGLLQIGGHAAAHDAQSNKSHHHVLGSHPSPHSKDFRSVMLVTSLTLELNMTSVIRLAVDLVEIRERQLSGRCDSAVFNYLVRVNRDHVAMFDDREH